MFYTIIWTLSSDQELKKIKGGAGTKPQGKPASNLVECVFSLYYLSN
ncbi:EntF family bacteriocin induction factor [Enterococcus faecium]|nr:EntF family bacteriocin induction factor [Enterococcus faecium]